MKKSVELFEKLLFGCGDYRMGQPYNKIGAVYMIMRLPEEKRKILQELKSEDLNIRPDAFWR